MAKKPHNNAGEIADQERRLNLALKKQRYEDARRKADIESGKLISREEVTAALARVVEAARNRLLNEAPDVIARRADQLDPPDVAAAATEVLAAAVEQLAADLEGAAA